jgi:putative PIN family toxin of toxin-antitoxin system
MRVLVDANIIISYAISGHKNSPITRVVEGALRGEFTLLLPEEVVEEFGRTVIAKRYLAERITIGEADELIATVRMVAEVIPALDVIPAVGRDVNDDYLIAYAVVGLAEYIVTGDGDVRSIGVAEHIKKVLPAQFVEVLKQQGM